MIVGLGTARLQALQTRLKQIILEAPKQACIAALPKVKDEIQFAFLSETAPTQKPWAPLKPKKFFGKEIAYPPGRPILKGLEQFFTVGLSENNKIYVRNSKWYAKFHFTGTKFMKDRRYLPFRGERVPSWERYVSAPIDVKIRALLGGR